MSNKSFACNTPSEAGAIIAWRNRSGDEMKFHGALRKSHIENIVEQVAHRHQLSQTGKNLLRDLVFDSLSKKVQVPEQQQEAFHDAIVMLQSAGHLNRDQETRSGRIQKSQIDQAKPSISHGTEEKRHFPRVTIDWPLTIKTPQGPVAGIMKDISASGAFVCGREAFKLNHQYPLANLHVRSSRLRLSIGAKVIRSNIHYIDDERVSLGMGVRFTRLSSEARKLIFALVSDQAKYETSDYRTNSTYPVIENNMRLEPDGRSVKFEVEPSSYPMVKLYCRSQSEDDDLEISVPLSRELWIHTARACEQIISGMDASSARKVNEALSLMAERILFEIQAEDKRLRYKATYEDFFDSVIEIYSRKDFDNARKGQMIHEVAGQVKL